LILGLLLPVTLLVSSASSAETKLAASIFSYDGKDFVRTETTLMQGGQSAVGTKLEHDSPAYKALSEKTLLHRAGDRVRSKLRGQLRTAYGCGWQTDRRPVRGRPEIEVELVLQGERPLSTSCGSRPPDHQRAFRASAKVWGAVASCYPASMHNFYGQDLAFVHAEAFEELASSAAETLLQVLGQGAPSRRVLDLGCGAGPLSQRLSEQGFSTWGLDLSPALIAVARERLPGAEFQCGSVLDVPLPKAAAAAAVGEVLNYATAHDPASLGGVFERVFEALAPGGVFLFDLAGPGRVGAGRSFTDGAKWAVGVVATESDDELLRNISTFREVDEGVWRRSYEEHRLRLWPTASVVEQLDSCGFRVEELPGYTGATMPPSLHVYLAMKPG
jgi:SAM-dependent methyltransferase